MVLASVILGAWCVLSIVVVGMWNVFRHLARMRSAAPSRTVRSSPNDRRVAPPISAAPVAVRNSTIRPITLGRRPGVPLS